MTEPVVLRDGRVVHVRPLGAQDRGELGAAIMRLSGRSRYLRFASPMPVLRERDLDRLLDLDHREREALVAADPRTGHGVAVARYAVFGDAPGEVEVAITVDDAWQGAGLGAVMLERVLARARENGFAVARASALSENRAARALLRRFGFAVASRDGLLIEYDRRLHPARDALTAHLGG